MNTKNKIAEKLLQINAIKLNTASPFTWASGWKSPIYCDNRKTLAFPEVRGLISDSFVELIKKELLPVDVVAGVATGAIAHGILVAHELGLPFVYVRPAPKKHGLENLIEGEIRPGQSVVVVEDLISTGRSSLKAVEALRNAGCIVKGMVAIFSYGFAIARQNFEQVGCSLWTLSNYDALISLALEKGYIDKTKLETLKQWREDPGNWIF